MNHFTQCPIPNPGGKDCWREPHPANSFGVCIEHWRKIVKQWHDEEPAASIYCMHCGNLAVIDVVELKSAVCPTCHLRMSDPGIVQEMVESHRAAEAQPRPEVNGVVYYMRFGDRVKIGFTGNLEIRAQQVPNDEVIAAEPGTFATEAKRHGEFAPELVSNTKEWFTMTPRLAFHMANVRDAHGDPFELSRKRRLIGSRR